MDFTYIVIVFGGWGDLLHNGNEAEHLQTELLFLLYCHFPIEEFSESFKRRRSNVKANMDFT